MKLLDEIIMRGGNVFFFFWVVPRFVASLIVVIPLILLCGLIGSSASWNYVIDKIWKSPDLT